MKKILTFLLSFMLIFSVSAHENCIPKNNLYISQFEKGVTMTEEEFNKDIDNIEKIYAPIVAEKYGATLKVVRKWEDGTVNAYAMQNGKTWEVHMFGGLARHQHTTDDGFMAVVCHEIGHHIGGAPKKKSWWSSSWASNEGQSDYFATTKCLRKFFEEDIEKTIQVYEEASASQALLAKDACDKVFSSKAEAAICYRASMAGKSLAKLLGDLAGNDNVKFDTPDPTVVSVTNDAHPKAQCRLDTYFQGALCDKDQKIFPDASDATIGYCMTKDGYEVGARPVCWYKP